MRSIAASSVARQIASRLGAKQCSRRMQSSNQEWFPQQHVTRARLDPPDSGPVFYVGMSGLDFRVAHPPEPIAKFLAEANRTHLR